MNTTNPDISLSSAAPCEEPQRQYYYIEKARTYIQKKSKEIGRPLTFCVTTFGCQMNARDSEKLRGILEKIGYEEAPEDVADLSSIIPARSGKTPIQGSTDVLAS